MNNENDRENVPRELRKAMRPLMVALGIGMIVAMLAVVGLVIYFLRLGGGIWGGR